MEKKLNLLTIGIGLLPCIYALYVLVFRLKGKDEKFVKLQPMKEKFGVTAGSIIHYVGYVVMPLIVGISIVIFGLQGMSIIDWLKI